MGSVTIILVPFLLVAVFIAQLFLGITGLDTTKVSLPYDPENGLVWEYDNINDPYIFLKETEIDGDKQIFRFKSREKLGDDYVYGCGSMMDLVFTDQNGNTETYYATTYGTDFHRVRIRPEDEIAVYQHTVTAAKTFEDSEWDLGFGTDTYCRYIVYNPEMKSNPESFTFTVAYEKGSDDDDIFWVFIESESFANDNHYLENHQLQLDCSGKEAKLLKEEFWSTDSLYN